MNYLNSILNYLHHSPQVLAAIIASVVAIWGIKTQRQISRQKNSLDFESSYKRNKEIAEANEIVMTLIIRLQEMNSDDLVRQEVQRCLLDKLPQNDQASELKKLRHAVNTILNEWERAANAVFSNIYDEGYLYRAHGTSIIKLYTYLRNYTESRQKVVPRYYINFSRLAFRWSIRRCIEDEKDSLSKRLNSALGLVQKAGVRFSGHQVTESHSGALTDLKKAQHEIWVVINKPIWIKHKLVCVLSYFKLTKN